MSKPPNDQAKMDFVYSLVGRRDIAQKGYSINVYRISAISR
jgi:hypothetical protein